MDHAADKNHLLAERIIELVGGPENIESVIHCVTRLRFYLKNEKMAHTAEIEDLEGVMGVAKGGGQYQVVIGTAVNDVYQAVMEQLQVTETPGASPAKEAEHPLEEKSTWGKTKSAANQLLGIITGSMTPIINILAASGVIKGLLALVVGLGWISDAGNFYLIVSAMADAVFYFLPVLIGFTAAQRIDGDPILTAVIGGAISYPTILEAANNGQSILSLGGLDFPYISYTYSIFPMILAAWLVKVFKRQLKNWVPAILQSLFIPVLVIFLVVSITFLVTGPIIMNVSFALAAGLQKLLSWNAPIFGAVIDGFYQVLVIFGLHWGIIPIYVNDFATLGQSQLSAIVSVTIVAQGGAALAVAVKSRKQDVKKLGYAAAISAFSGITEPAIYGITLRYRKPFICASIASAVGGLMTGVWNVTMWSIIGSLIGIPSFIDPENGITANFWYAMIITFGTLILAFILTYFWGYNDSMKMEAKREKPQNPAKMPLNLK